MVIKKTVTLPLKLSLLALTIGILSLTACTSEQLKRSAYEGAKTSNRIKCQSNPAIPCPADEPYNKYEKMRELEMEMERQN